MAQTLGGLSLVSALFPYVPQIPPHICPSSHTYSLSIYCCQALLKGLSLPPEPGWVLEMMLGWVMGGE